MSKSKIPTRNLIFAIFCYVLLIAEALQDQQETNRGSVLDPRVKQMLQSAEDAIRQQGKRIEGLEKKLGIAEGEIKELKEKVNRGVNSTHQTQLVSHINWQPPSCQDLWTLGHSNSGFYTIKGLKDEFITVYCDMNKHGEIVTELHDGLVTTTHRPIIAITTPAEAKDCEKLLTEVEKWPTGFKTAGIRFPIDKKISSWTMELKFSATLEKLDVWNAVQLSPNGLIYRLVNEEYNGRQMPGTIFKSAVGFAAEFTSVSAVSSLIGVKFNGVAIC